MGKSTFSQYQDSMIKDLNRFGEFDHIVNTLKEISNLGGISELARMQQESANRLGELMESMGDVVELREEELSILSNQMLDALTEICNFDGISELARMHQESSNHLAEMMQSMMSNNGMIDLLADANRLSEAALCNLRMELTFLSEPYNYFNRELVNEFSRHESLVEVVCAGGVISGQGLLDWLTQTRNKDFEEKSEAVDNGLKNIGELTPESEKLLVCLICAFLIFMITAISLHNRGETFEATEVAKLALNILPIIYPLLRFKQH